MTLKVNQADVPQGYVLRPLILNLYLKDLFHFVAKSQVCVHNYKLKPRSQFNGSLAMVCKRTLPNFKISYR